MLPLHGTAWQIVYSLSLSFLYSWFCNLHCFCVCFQHLVKLKQGCRDVRRTLYDLCMIWQTLPQHKTIQGKYAKWFEKIICFGTTQNGSRVKAPLLCTIYISLDLLMSSSRILLWTVWKAVRRAPPLYPSICWYGKTWGRESSISLMYRADISSQQWWHWVGVVGVNSAELSADEMRAWPVFLARHN